MNITYDKKADAMYIYLNKGKKVARTVELSDFLVADLDKQGKIIGIEILCASKQLGKDKESKTKPSLLFNLDIPIPITV
ncbi:MAG: DUF2283 domain-containing protein [bacterium]|nr:DUF2283 domain-containing protein [bacterium]